MASSIDDYFVKEAVLYVPQKNEMEIAKACFAMQFPLMLRGPTGIGKTTFLSYLAHEFQLPLISETCTEDTTANTLIGSFNLQGWYDGSATFAIKHAPGALYYLDEIGEARPEAIVIIHGLTDDRREIDVRAVGHKYKAGSRHMVLGSYNPTYQKQAKLKPSTLQRFVTLDIDFPTEETELSILSAKYGARTYQRKEIAPLRPNIIDEAVMKQVVGLANAYRSLAKAKELREGPGTRLLSMSLGLYSQGIPLDQAIEVALINPLTHEEEKISALKSMIKTHAKR